MSDKAGDVRSRLKATQAEVARGPAALAAAAAEVLAGAKLHLAEAGRRARAARREAETRRQAVRRPVASGRDAGQPGRSRRVATGRRAAIGAASTSGSWPSWRPAKAELAEQLAAAQRARAAARRADSPPIRTQLETAAERAGREPQPARLAGRRSGPAPRPPAAASPSGPTCWRNSSGRSEGIGAGVKQVLARAGVQAATSGRGVQEGQGSGVRVQEVRVQSSDQQFDPWSLVRGVVADFVQVGVEHAAAIDVALGEAAQAVVVEGDADAAIPGAARRRASDLTGRVVVFRRLTTRARRSLAQLPS